MVWKYFWWYFIMFANSRNTMKHHSYPLCVWHVGRLRRITTSVSSRQASGWYPKCVAWSWAMPQQFGARCFLVFCFCAFLQVSSEGLCEWWCPALSSWRAQSTSITFPWWWSPCCLDCSGRVAVGWRWCQAKRFAGFSWGSLFGRLTARLCRSLRVGHFQQHHFCLLLADLQANSLCVSAESGRLFLDVLVSMGDQG